MPTQVLNLRYAQPQPGEVRIDRKTRWGNPFIIGRDGDRAQVIAQYETKLRADLASGRISAQDVAALHNKRLFCWCAPLACHGHVLARVAAELQQPSAGETTARTVTKDGELDRISDDDRQPRTPAGWDVIEA